MWWFRIMQHHTGIIGGLGMYNLSSFLLCIFSLPSTVSLCDSHASVATRFLFCDTTVSTTSSIVNFKDCRQKYNERNPQNSAMIAPTNLELHKIAFNHIEDMTSLPNQASNDDPRPGTLCRNAGGQICKVDNSRDKIRHLRDSVLHWLQSSIKLYVELSLTLLRVFC